MTDRRILDYEGVLGLLGTERYVPIDEIAEHLVSSKVVARKVVMNLRRDGYAIEQAFGQGYRRTPSRDTIGTPIVVRKQGVAPALGTLGALIHRHRQHLGLSKARLAAILGMSPSNLHQVERNEVVPTRPTVARLAEVLCVDPYDRDMLYILAGYCPPTIAGLSPRRLEALLALANGEEEAA